MLYAWLTWTGSSLAMTTFAALIVCYQPACASSGIPGLIAYLNGVKPLGGVSHITGKMTSFVSVKTMLCKLVGMLASIPSGLCKLKCVVLVSLSNILKMETIKTPKNLIFKKKKNI